MKSILISVITVFAFSCGANSQNSNGANISKIHEADFDLSFTCSNSVPGPNDYNIKIDIYDDTMDVSQSATNARFAMLRYVIVQDSALIIPSEGTLYTCSLWQPEFDNYSLRIHVYEDSLIILQSSTHGRFASLKYKIKRSINNAE